MSRMVFSLFFEKLPDLKVITHHMGAYIPHAEGRISPHWEDLGSRDFGEDYSKTREAMKKRPEEYFKMFYADTAMFGARSATQCGLDYFGVDKAVFATDFPYDPEGGSMLVRDTLRVISELNCNDDDRDKMFQRNIRRITGLGG